jgi:hypothetical protein
MFALLKLIPIRDYLWAALLIVVGCFALHYRRMEKEIHQVAAVGKAAQVLVKKDDAQAQTTETQNAIIYEKAVAIPAIADIGISCVRDTGGGQVPTTNPVTAAAPGDHASDGEQGPPYDPSGAILTRGADADAQIAYLQARIAELEKQMNEGP